MPLRILLPEQIVQVLVSMRKQALMAVALHSSVLDMCCCHDATWALHLLPCFV